MNKKCEIIDITINENKEVWVKHKWTWRENLITGKKDIFTITGQLPSMEEYVVKNIRQNKDKYVYNKEQNRIELKDDNK